MKRLRWRAGTSSSMRCKISLGKVIVTFCVSALAVLMVIVDTSSVYCSSIPSHTLRVK